MINDRSWVVSGKSTISVQNANTGKSASGSKIPYKLDGLFENLRTGIERQGRLHMDSPCLQLRPCLQAVRFHCWMARVQPQNMTTESLIGSFSPQRRGPLLFPTPSRQMGIGLQKPVRPRLRPAALFRRLASFPSTTKRQIERDPLFDPGATNGD